jgi:hypothetical protein
MPDDARIVQDRPRASGGATPGAGGRTAPSDGADEQPRRLSVRRAPETPPLASAGSKA